jgi:small-conductance mechanosensitive channel
VIGLVEFRAGNEADTASTLGNAVGIIRLLVTVICFAIAILLILDNLGVNTTGLVASLGVGGIAIGLAAQGIFADLFAALSIIFDKPFRRGDNISWDQAQGTVEAIGLKTTRIRSLTGEQIVISNTNLLGKEVHNLTERERRRVMLPFGLIYQTPPAMLDRARVIAIEIVEQDERCQLVRCGITALGDSSIDYELHFDVLSQAFLDPRHELIVNLISRFAAEGLEFAYPTQTTFTAAPDGTMIMPYSSALTSIAEHLGDVAAPKND